jgi:DNA-binding IscR family transcriptional regulator
MSSTEIAGSVNTNPVVIRRILGILTEAGLTTTLLGSEGGADLARPPAEMSLLDVYRATEGGGLFALHANPPNPQCLCGSNIQPVLSPYYAQAESALEASLAETTLAQVAADIQARIAMAGEYSE